MSHLDISTTPQIQFPLRLSHELTKRLNQAAKSTRINKTTLGRIAIKSLLDSIEEKGITKTLSDVAE